MDFSKLSGQIFYHNKFIKHRDAKIHVLNHSLHFAGSVFEGIAVYNSKPLFLNDHYLRLKKSSKLMKLVLHINLNSFKKICESLIKKNKIKNGYIRPIIFRSSHSMSPETAKCNSILVIATWNWGKLFKKKGIKINISKYPKLNKSIFPIEAKSSGSYQSSVIAKIEASKKGYDDCLMLDMNNKIAETTACNIFWIKKKTIFTPGISSILNGITRRSIIEICKLKKIDIKIGNYKIKDIYKADKVFATGTAAEIQEIKQIKNVKFLKKSKILDILVNDYNLIKKNVQIVSKI